MYLLYLDESGSPSAGNADDHLVLGGLAVHEGQVYNGSFGDKGAIGGKKQVFTRDC